MGTRLFVGNLSYTSTENDVRDLFQQVGSVVKCELVLDKFTSKSRGFAFVEMSSQDEADKAVQEFNGKDLQGRRLTVNEARPRESRPPRSGGGGGGDYGGEPPHGGKADWQGRRGR
jgi:RNA recognition motif-containing protein